MCSLDDSSSLSSDPGMISGTEASGTTTTSSMSSSTGGDPISLYVSKPNSKYVSNKSSSKVKSTIKKTDSSMQTESMSALSSTTIWKRYLHEHHLMMKANNTVAPKAVITGNDEGTKSLDRLDSRLANGTNTKKLINASKITERHDSYESLKHNMSKANNLKHDLGLLSNKRPLSSPSSSRTAVTTTPGPVLKQYSVQRQTHKSKVIGSTQTDSPHSDSEYVQQKHNHNLQQIMSNKYSYMNSPLRQRDASSRLSSYADIGGYSGGTDSQSATSHNSMSPWLQRHALAMQRNALTDAESMESLNGPLSLDANYFLSRTHSSSSRPNSASVRLRESASASPGFNSSQNRSKEHSSQLMRSGSVRGNKSSEPISQPTSPTRFMNHIYNSPIHESNINSSLAQQRTPTTTGSISQFNHNPKEEDLMHGSSLSLVSTSSMFSAVSKSLRITSMNIYF